MPPTPPDESEANSEAQAAIAAVIAAANAAFIAYATVLINNAISNGLFEVQPIITANTDIPTVTAYFVGQGYTVTYPIIPPGPFTPPVLLPQVIPPGYVYPNQPFQPGPPRLQISW